MEREYLPNTMTSVLSFIPLRWDFHHAYKRGCALMSGHNRMFLGVCLAWFGFTRLKVAQCTAMIGSRLGLVFFLCALASTRVVVGQSHDAPVTGSAKELTEPVIEALGRLPRGRGVVALTRALDQGLPDARADAALKALGNQGGKEATALLLEYTHHRRPQARIAAYRALAHANHQLATTALATGLGDRDAQVREVCVQLLREVGDAKAAPRLLAALDRGVAGAAQAYATLAPAKDLDALTTRLQSLPLPPLLDAYGIVLRRSDVAPDKKLQWIYELKEQGTPAVRHFLTQLVSDQQIQKNQALRNALVRAIARIPMTLEKKSP